MLNKLGRNLEGFLNNENGPADFFGGADTEPVTKKQVEEIFVEWAAEEDDEFENEELYTQEDVDRLLFLVTDKINEYVAEYIQKKIKEITDGERFVTTEQLKEIEEIAYVYAENCGASGTDRGTLFVMYLTDKNGEKTKTYICEVVELYEHE